MGTDLEEETQTGDPGVHRAGRQVRLQQLEEGLQLVGAGLQDGCHQLVRQGGGVGSHHQLQHLAHSRVLVPFGQAEFK